MQVRDGGLSPKAKTETTELFMGLGARLLWSLAPLLMLSPAFAQGSKVSSAVELTRQADKLRPGDWLWAPEIALKGPVMVYVDLAAQLATVYRNGVRIGVSTASTGKAGHETPTGVFSILQKDPHHRSSTYNNAPMPYQERSTMAPVLPTSTGRNLTILASRDDD